MRKYVAWVGGYWRRHKLHIAGLVLMTVLSSAVVLSFPLVFMYILDNLEEVLGAGSSREFWRVVLVLLALGVAKFVAGLYPGARAWLNSKIGLDVRDDVFDSLKEKDYRFFNRFRPGDVTTRLTDDIVEWPRIAWFSCSAVFRALESSSRLLFCLVVMLLMSWELTLISVAPLPVMLYVFSRIESRLGRKVDQSRKATSMTGDLLDSTFAGISIVKAYGAEEGQQKRLRGILDQRLRIDFDLSRLLMMLHSLYHLMGQLGKVTVVLVGGLFVVRGRIGLGEFYAFYVYLDLLLAPMMDIPELFVTSRQAFASIGREEEIVRFPSRPERKGEIDPGRIRKVELRGAGFRHPEGGGISGVDLEVRAPCTVAVVGEVGSGKSSLLKILAGLFPLTEGELLLNGVPVQEVSEEALSRETGYVPQESVLFSETVAENVRLGRPLPVPDVLGALRSAGMPPEELQDGEKTLLGHGGIGVSGGQKQRVAIARAVACDPSLYLFDDCTAALDAEREEELWGRLGSLAGDALSFVVTHRESTVRRADLVMLLHRGRLMEVGTHAGLMDGSRLYRYVLTTEMHGARKVERA
ncbi:ATP-binding cassette domain-containing protein [Candidatus Fermentibacteria bacterium]|nr:ATP-binding cassette domain-containing protein [Candidatus Fermentibacteria bacterium]